MTNVLDYLADADLTLYTNPVSVFERAEAPGRAGRVSWHGHDPSADFLITRRHGTIEQYLRWLTSGSYSAVLRDASLLQITYDIAGNKIASRRLAYVPCPFIVDAEYQDGALPLDEVMDLYADLSDVRPPVPDPLRLRPQGG